MLKFLVLLSVIQIILAGPLPKPPSGIKYAKQGQTPWTVLIHIRENRCTGSLVKDKYVITAAHCFDIQNDDENEFRLEHDVKIFIGELDLTRDPDCDDDNDEENSDECVSEPVAEIPPKSLAIHELYQDEKGVKNYAYDIAVITLKRPPRKSEIIKNIELPEESECEDNEVSGTMINSGFGEIKHKEYTEIKKITNINIITNMAVCKKDLGKLFNEFRHFCGKSPTKITTCKGDSGGPLSQRIGDVDYLLGIVSFGTPECSVSEKATAFVKVDCLIPWITENTKDKKSAPKTTKTTTTTTEANVSGGDDEDDDIFG